MAAKNLNLDNALCFAIYSANHAITRAYKPILDPHGLTYPQYLVLLILWERDGQTVGSIGQHLFLESSTLTPLLKRMEKAGYVRRERAADDERQVCIFLTDAGKALQTALAEVPRRLLAAFGCGAKEAETLHDQVTTLRDNVSKTTSG
ncbi:MarR family transcriptional regulator [Hyphomicrobium sp.]|uniref:MarR family winged helix-turn-helix transcriptional regulator n=1 Tax=Hyphomicrobium sp. TaxID=82 RepID=UPI002C502FCA|nr:MarR family transcriptional regulator [Hyphomicrobium sp.]HRN88268.1 MarR family transcriptional regulator [Hyphomicrobium sp.]HRQ27868.1 MarR family transcriptional regulator [Hyphomicrobium sp.]